MNIKIIYASMTGHSKKIATTMATRLGIPAYNIVEKPNIQPCDLLFIVSGIYGGQCKPELLSFVETLSAQQVKKVVMITSSVKKANQGALREALVKKGIEVVNEEYLCQGSFLFMAFSHPNQVEINGAVEFAQKYIGK